MDLTQFDSMFAGAKEADDEPPDGMYVAQIHKVEWAYSQSSGKAMLKWQLQIADGPHKGRMLFRNNILETPENAAWLKRDLKSCGIQVPEKISTLNLAALLDRFVEVQKKTKGEYTNVYIRRSVGAPAETSKVPF